MDKVASAPKREKGLRPALRAVRVFWQEEMAFSDQFFIMFGSFVSASDEAVQG
jgi:hypothetical protein